MTFMATAAAIGAGGSIIGGLIGASGAKKAASQQAQAAREQLALQREMFGTLGYALRGMPELQPVPLPPHEHWITDAADLLAAFVQIVRGTTAPLCTGRDHLRSLLMLQACITSSQRQEALELAEIEDGIVKVL